MGGALQHVQSPDLMLIEFSPLAFRNAGPIPQAKRWNPGLAPDLLQLLNPSPLGAPWSGQRLVHQALQPFADLGQLLFPNCCPIEVILTRSNIKENVWK